MLTAEPRLLYFKDQTEYKGEVLLSRTAKAVRIDNHKFEIVIPGRTYFLRTIGKAFKSDEWVDLINKVIKEKYQI